MARALDGPEDTIVALSSGQGRAGVAVLRLSGRQSRFVVETLAGTVPPPRQATLRTIRDRSGQQIDTGLILFFAAPASFTGEDVAEFQVHGSRAVVKAMLTEIAGLPGCRVAEPGEFTQRAVRAGRLDLTAAEALADLIDSSTERQRRQALRLSGGVLGHLAETWRRQILAMQARLVASLDFPDERDIPEDVLAPLEDDLRTLRASMAEALGTGRRGRLIAEGIRVVIAGPPNAGKSSLLNALARRDIAIVTPHAGTTRDVLDVMLDLDGMPVVLSDTAGLRETGDPVERLGIERAVGAVAMADVVLWLEPADGCGTARPPGQSADKVMIRVRSKWDLLADHTADDDAALSVSTVTGAGIPELIDRLRQACIELVAGDDPVVASVRQEEALRGAVMIADRALAHPPSGAEFMAEDLRQLGRALDGLIGKIDVESVLGEVFSRFCLGK